jgi:hypothetical protein
VSSIPFTTTCWDLVPFSHSIISFWYGGVWPLSEGLVFGEWKEQMMLISLTFQLQQCGKWKTGDPSALSKIQWGCQILCQKQKSRIKDNS